PDYVTPDSWVLNHSWSLSVEEQFYALWPLLLVIVGAAKARRTALLLIFAAPLARVLTYFYAPHLRPAITSMLHLRIDALMIGCWAALEQRLNPSSRPLEILGRPRTAAFAAAYCILIAGVVRHVGFANVAFGYGLEELSACSLVLWALRHPASKPARVLNSPAFVHAGAISYRLYPWPPLWLAHERPTPLWQIPPPVIGVVLFAAASHRAVVRRLVRERDDGAHQLWSLAARRTAGEQRAIDLQRVELQPQQRIERARSGPEIVHGQPHAAIPQLADPHGVLAALQGALGQLQRELRGIETVLGKDAVDVLEQVAVLELPRGQVHVQCQRLRAGPPAAVEVAAGLAEQPASDGDDQPGL